MKKILAFVLTLTLLTAVPASFASLDYNGETHTCYCSTCKANTSHEFCYGVPSYSDNYDGTHKKTTYVEDICTMCNDREVYTDLIITEAHIFENGYCICGADACNLPS